ncbi:MAG TPA: T9SS type A sorting domain-containing protein [Flavobacteriales bacterium]|nr:T9SS type A sorting domain-containing protein [Flavobacteriales bacterium]
MNKYLLFATLMFAGLSQVAYAQTRATRTSVMNGNATNPFTWDCTCIPVPGDNIIINHTVVLDADFGYTSGSVTINAAGALNGDIPTRAFAYTGGSFTNNGIVNLGDFYHGGGTFSNTGLFTIQNAYAVDLTANTVNSGTFNVSDTLYINVNAIFTNSGTVNAPVIATAGTLTNMGTVNATDIFNSGTLNNNGGPGFTMDNLYTSGNVINNAEMQIDFDLWNSETFTNDNLIVIDNNFWNGDTIAGTATFTNNGTISIAVDLNNSETMDGSGDYCVAGVSSNVGTVTGTLDVCDLSGTDFDNNFGTIAGTVTFCSAGSCAIGIAENALFEHTVYPNPFNSAVNFETKENGSYSLVVMNSIGETVFTTSFTGNRYALDASAFTSGMYFYRLTGNTAIVSGTLVK